MINLWKRWLGKSDMEPLTASDAAAPSPPRSSVPSVAPVIAGPVDARKAAKLIAGNNAPADLEVSEALSLRREKITSLPKGLTAPSISVNSNSLRALPDHLSARRITVRGDHLEHLGRGIECDTLDLDATAITEVPDDLIARQRLVLSNCQRLTRLPEGLTTGTLIINGCTSLAELPSGLDVAFLEAEGCSSLRQLPEDMTLRGGHLNVRDCPWLTKLPDNLGSVSGLDVSGCLNLTQLPENLEITSWIDFAGSGIRALPDSLADVGLRWRGIPVSRRIIFEPETLSAADILGERNAELRRVMMERFGYDRLFEASNAVELDRDEDAGGQRRLMRIPLENDEDLVCVFVQCPSTGHKFSLRVPPHMTTCHQAVAWTAGYDDPSAYKPVQET